MPDNQQLTLLTGPMSPWQWTLSLKHREFVMMQIAETQIDNIMWVRSLSLKLAWPPFRWVDGFVCLDHGRP